MASQRQRKLAEKIIENASIDKPKGIVSLVESVGYSKLSAEKKSGEIVKSEGVQNELSRLGFTEDNAKKVVAEIMMNPEVEPGARLKATDQTFKIHGTYAAEKSINLNVDLTIENSEELEKMANILKLNDRKGLFETGVGGDGVSPDTLGQEVQDKK